MKHLETVAIVIAWLAAIMQVWSNWLLRGWPGIIVAGAMVVGGYSLGSLAVIRERRRLRQVTEHLEAICRQAVADAHQVLKDREGRSE